MPQHAHSPHLAAQEHFDAVTATAFRKFGPRLIDLSWANPYGGPDPRVLQAIQRALEDTRDLNFQYTPYGGSTTPRRLIATHLNRRFDLGFNYRDVVMTPGAMAALNMVFRGLVDPDGEILVLTPCWIDYPLYLDNLGLRSRLIPLGPDKHFDLEAIGRALTDRTRAIIFSHPACPTGVLYRDGELADLAALLRDAEARFGTRIYLISDEVHRDVVWSELPYHTPLAYYPRSVSIYSFGKSLFIQGQRVGYVAVSPSMPEREELWALLPRLARQMGFCTPTNLMQRTVTYLLDFKPPLAFIAEQHRLAREALARAGYEAIPGEATFFVYVKSPMADEVAFSERLAARGVLALPSAIFHEPGYFRLALTDRAEKIQAGLGVVAALAQEGKGAAA